MAQRRRFSAKVKTQVVLDVRTGRRSVAPRCREQSLQEQVVTRWRAAFLDRAERLFRTAPEQDGPLERLAALARVVGRLPMALDRATKASPLWGARATRSGS